MKWGNTMDRGRIVTVAPTPALRRDAFVVNCAAFLLIAGTILEQVG